MSQMRAYSKQKNSYAAWRKTWKRARNFLKISGNEV
jgi:hypothetical protein